MELSSESPCGPFIATLQAEDGKTSLTLSHATDGKVATLAVSDRELDPRALSLVWLPEGDGVGLYDGDTLIAVIPPWAGADGFSGYAPLRDDNVLYERFAEARAFAERWSREDNPFPALQDAEMAAYESAFGTHKRYFATDGGKFPPRAVVWFEHQDQIILATIGMCIRPQPRVERVVDDPRPLRRIELLVEPPDLARTMPLASYLGGQSDFPWHFSTWLGENHTLPCAPLGRTVKLERDARVTLPDWDGDPVNLLALR